jgi:DNA-binding transcriptional MerR regulator
MSKYYYTIGEVCNLLELKPHIIRYWETEFRQLNPRREKGKNRRYTIEQIDLLRNIKDLLYIQKYTIKGVKNRLKKYEEQAGQNKPVKVLAINDEMRNKLIAELSELKELLNDDQSSDSDTEPNPF